MELCHEVDHLREKLTNAVAQCDGTFDLSQVVDAAIAVLAPKMTAPPSALREKLDEIVVRALAAQQAFADWRSEPVKYEEAPPEPCSEDVVREILSVITPALDAARREERERCAEAAETFDGFAIGAAYWPRAIAERIRALKDPA